MNRLAKEVLDAGRALASAEDALSMLARVHETVERSGLDAAAFFVRVTGFGQNDELDEQLKRAVLECWGPVHEATQRRLALHRNSALETLRALVARGAQS